MVDVVCRVWRYRLASQRLIPGRLLGFRIHTTTDLGLNVLRVFAVRGCDLHAGLIVSTAKASCSPTALYSSNAARKSSNSGDT